MSNLMLETKVREVMSGNPITVGQDVKVHVAIELMQQHNVRRLPVLGRADQLVGIITMEDAREAMPRGVPFHGGDEAAEATVPDVRRAMSHHIVTVGADAPVAQAAQLMLEHKIGSLPVLELGAMIGIITESDIFKFVARGLPPLQSESEFQ